MVTATSWIFQLVGYCPDSNKTGIAHRLLTASAWLLSPLPRNHNPEEPGEPHSNQ
jgi:hypothetical protein